ncbi:MAG TPA: hypothetical protein VFC19_49835 [Candidatus Limnocylindrales bacterium]|nr:hypothetical protein [Candidatus Limnocylindrales bacterium]
MVAAEVGVPPSDPAMHEHMLRRFGLDAAQCLYVDESEANARAAESLGIAAHRYTWITPLRRELRARGFLPIPPVIRP